MIFIFSDQQRYITLKETPMSLNIRSVVALLEVFDMHKSVAFYCDMLGFKVRGPKMDPFYFATLELGDIQLMLNAAYEDDDGHLHRTLNESSPTPTRLLCISGATTPMKSTPTFAARDGIHRSLPRRIMACGRSTPRTRTDTGCAFSTPLTCQRSQVTISRPR